MKITAGGGTDAANIVLVWPDNFPEGADVSLKTDPMALVESVRDQGKLIWFPCDGDGDYTVANFVRSELPADLMALCRDREDIPALHVRDVGYFGGMEYMFKHDSSSLDKYPSMCEQVRLPEGTYSASVYRVGISDELYESWLQTQVGATAKRFGDIHSTVTAWAIASVLVSLVAFFCVTLTVWFCSLALAMTLVFIAVAMSRTGSYKNVVKARDDFAKEYPSFVVHLQ